MCNAPFSCIDRWSNYPWELCYLILWMDDIWNIVSVMNKMLIMEIYRLNGIEYVTFGNVMTIIDV